MIHSLWSKMRRRGRPRAAAPTVPPPPTTTTTISTLPDDLQALGAQLEDARAAWDQAHAQEIFVGQRLHQYRKQLAAQEEEVAAVLAVVEEDSDEPDGEDIEEEQPDHTRTNQRQRNHEALVQVAARHKEMVVECERWRRQIHELEQRQLVLQQALEDCDPAELALEQATRPDEDVEAPHRTTEERALLSSNDSLDVAGERPSADNDEAVVHAYAAAFDQSISLNRRCSSTQEDDDDGVDHNETEPLRVV